MLVDTFKINLPCTVSFPFDFFKSSVSISKNRKSGYVRQGVKKAKRIGNLIYLCVLVTVAAHIKVKDRVHLDIDNTKESLILLFELLLVEHLYGYHASIGYLPMNSHKS